MSHVLQSDKLYFDNLPEMHKMFNQAKYTQLDYLSLE